MSNEQKIWSFLIGKIGNPYGVAGLMGNLNAESALNPNNLQNSYEHSLGMTDTQYTAAVDKTSPSTLRFLLVLWLIWMKWLRKT